MLLDVPNFDIVHDSPGEYLHSVCLGVVKKLVELTFSVGEIRPRKTKRKLSKPATFNLLMLECLTPREFSRRARELDFSVMKGAEFRNLAIFFFIIIIECIEVGQGERKLWLYLAYMIRACIIPVEEYSFVNQNDITDCCQKYYKLYEKLMGEENCTYNTHLVLSHLPKIRVHGPLTLTSAFGFESFYGEMRHCFVPETGSPLKQILSKVILKRTLSHHSCKIPIFYSNYKTSLEDNSMIYCWENNDHNIYIIQDIVDDENLICKKIGKYPHEFEETPTLNWARVGVYKKGGIGPENYIVNKKKISGKVLHVMNFLITCPNNILREK